MPSRIHIINRIWQALLLAAIMATALLVLSRPLAQTNLLPSTEIEHTEQAREIASLFSREQSARLSRLGVDIETVRRFYERRRYEPTWTKSIKGKSSAAAAISALVHGEEDGLATLSARQAELLKQAESGDAPLYDVLLTDAVLRYVRELRVGRLTPAAVYRDALLPTQLFDPVEALQAAFSQGNFSRLFVDAAPLHQEYQRLKAALATYRRIAAEGGWPQIARGGHASIDPGDARIPALLVRLAREQAPLPGDIVEALRDYQARNGLEPDGKLGPETIEMLNISASERVEQIIANLERWRWLPRILETRFVMVNAADATLQVIDNGRVVLRSRVIVGTSRTPTPIFRAEATEVTVNPVWNVPPSIAVNEILPKLRRDPNYLVSQHMVLLNGPSGDPHGTRIDWQHVSAKAFPYRIQQAPGKDNALGALKLEMPNLFNVYLHDTPAKSAFQASRRTLSHGCVRVQEILPLASIALEGNAVSAVARLTGSVLSGENRRLPIIEPLPVYIVYWTAIADADGVLQFRRDVYGRDKVLMSALAATKHPLDIVLEGCATTEMRRAPVN